MMRQAVGVGVERGVAQPAVAEDHRRGLRRARGLRRKQRRQRRRPGGRRARRRGCAVGGGADASAEDRQGCTSGCEVSFQSRRMVSRSDASSTGSVAQRPLRIGNRPLQQPDQPRPQRLHRAALEQVACVFQHAVDAGRRAGGGAPLAQPQRQVELRARRATGCRRRPASPAGRDRRPPPRSRSRTPASPGTADAATASAPD